MNNTNSKPLMRVKGAPGKTGAAVVEQKRGCGSPSARSSGAATIARRDSTRWALRSS